MPLDAARDNRTGDLHIGKGGPGAIFALEFCDTIVLIVTSILALLQTILYFTEISRSLSSSSKPWVYSEGRSYFFEALT